ncbi:hypothetical protein YSA_08826 [Pseudomonas putida ND6]|uniref:Uncharacterized protein n=1 Tax=Pseudomonas putida ND6 TaxID=231023 RepID=I3V1C4_PSEPU|nr:hypothetical protein YSA_08826 [Pseudomonas putida ND6]
MSRKPPDAEACAIEVHLSKVRAYARNGQRIFGLW